MRPRRRDPVPLYVVGLFGVAAATVAVDVGLAPVRSEVAWWTVVPFVLLLTAAEYLLVRFVYRGEVDALNLVEAVLAPAFLALPAAAVVAVVGVAQAVAALLRRNSPVKAAFNMAQWTAAAGAGAVVFDALRTPGSPVAGRTIGALVVALTVVTVCNQLAFANVMRLVNGESWAATLAGLRPVILPGWVGGWVVNTSFGVLFALAYAATPWSLPLLSVPLVMLHAASRAFATARTDRIRLAGLHRATHVLAAPIDPRDAIGEFLHVVLASFEADCVELVRRTSDVPRRHRLRRDGVLEEYEVSDGLAVALLDIVAPVRVVAESPSPLAGLLPAEGWPDCAAAPLLSEQRSLGVLCVYGRSGAEGFDDGELAVLQALAAEAAAAFRKTELLEAMLEQRRKLSAIVDNTSDGILAVDADGRVQTWNPGLEAITGHAAASMIGTHHLGVLRARDTQGEDVLLEQWARRPFTVPTELQIVAADGRTRWLSCSSTRVPSQDGALPLLVVMVRDVTRVHELDRLKEDFVATVSHELRTPLTPIKGFANLLLESGERLNAGGRRTAAESILRSAQRLERLIVNLLAVSRVECDVIDVHDAVVVVDAVVGRVVEEFRTTFPERSIVVACDSQVEARGSELWVEQIVSNLLSNAVRYAPTGPIEVAVAVTHATVELTVTDHGPGVPEHDADRIFERFERLDLARQQAGTGLGLYIARELAHAMHGTLAVRPAPDGGAVFSLRLPAQPQVVPLP